MANKQNRYAPEFRRQMVELARAGRTPAELSREFGPSAWTIALILTRGAELALDAGKLALRSRADVSARAPGIPVPA